MNEQPESAAGGIVLYESPDGRARLSVRIDGQTAWLTQAQMAELFQTSRPNITQHIRNVLEEKELPEASVCKEHLLTAADGKHYATLHYSLDMIIAVGYRVRSERGTQFRQWATTTLREYLVKGFALDDQRLKDNRHLGQDYFDELLERIRDIRAGERRFYQKITDIYATSIDYDAHSDQTQTFFATVQNKLHWAIHGHTAAEIVVERAGAAKPNMGLTTWKNAPKGAIRKTDVNVAKNYLTQEEIAALNRIVTMYLDYAEEQARRQTPMHMADWAKKLDGFLQFNERNILTHAGKVTAALAEDHAGREFAKFEQARLEQSAREPTSDFDQLIEETKQSEHEKPRLPPAKPKRSKKK